MMKKFLLFTFLLFPFFSQAQVSLVKDINPFGSSLAFGKLDAAVLNGQLIFSASDGNTTNIRQVWISDGTLSGTELLHQITPFSVDGNAINFYFSTTLGKVIFFANNGASNTTCLYTTDGTTMGLENLSGTNYVFIPIQFPNYFTDFNGQVYFNLLVAAQTIGYELYVTDGTETGTGLLKELRPGVFGGIPSELTVFNNNLYFSSSDPANAGRELWVSDGTTAGTNIFIDINPGNTSSNPESLVVFNGKLYFTADDGVNGTELWVTDGTVSGTQLVLDLYAGATGSSPQNLTVYNNALYFTANHPTLGTEIFKMTTSQSITNLRNIAAGNGSSNPQYLFVFNGALYFSADDGVNGIELWSSTGFPSTTNLLKNINTSPSSPDSNPSGFTEYFGELYFAANDGVNGRELWKTDGTNAGTVLVDNINLSGDSNPSDLIVANNQLFFSANNGTTGIELWKYQDASLSVNDIELENSISLFPNPSKTSFSIETKYQINNISVFDIQGKTVKSFKENLAFYDIEDLISGLYFVNIKTDNGTITKKLIKE